MTTPTPDRQYDLTRRSLFLGAAASLLCAPAIVQATSLMPVRGLILPIERPQAGFCQRLFYYLLDCQLRAGKVTLMHNGSIVPEADARRRVAYARVQGWLPQINGEGPGYKIETNHERIIRPKRLGQTP
jgi:hypothetical protein